MGFTHRAAAVLRRRHVAVLAVSHGPLFGSNAARASLLGLVSRTIFVLAYGEIVRSGGREAFRRAYAWL